MDSESFFGTDSESEVQNFLCSTVLAIFASFSAIYRNFRVSGESTVGRVILFFGNERVEK